jgi:hypothetical protein
MSLFELTINPYRLYSIKELMELEGISHAEVYRRIRQGQYAPVVKDGRSTKVFGSGINARRADKLMPFKPASTLNAISPGG